MRGGIHPKIGRGFTYFMATLLGLTSAILAGEYSSQAAQAVVPPHAFTIAEDVVYGRSHPVGGTPIKGATPIDRVMDVYLPETYTSTGMPAVVLLHGNPGGSPYPGKRQHGFRPLASDLARLGYATFVVAYPFFGLVEAKTATRHIRANAEVYGINPNHIAALGHSLGSNLSMRLAVTGDEQGQPNSAEKKDPANNWGVSAKVNAAILVGGGAASRPYEEFDPQDPPLCFVHGTADPLAPFKQALKRTLVCQDTGIPYAFLRVEGMGHKVPSPRRVVAFGQTFVEFLDAFLRSHMLGEADTGTTTLFVATQGKGSVALTPEHAIYPQGTAVTLTATPAARHSFLHWRGDVESDTPTISFVMESNRQVIAVFEKKKRRRRLNQD